MWCKYPTIWQIISLGQAALGKINWCLSNRSRVCLDQHCVLRKHHVYQFHWHIVIPTPFTLDTPQEKPAKRSDTIVSRVVFDVRGRINHGISWVDVRHMLRVRPQIPGPPASFGDCRLDEKSAKCKQASWASCKLRARIFGWWLELTRILWGWDQCKANAKNVKHSICIYTQFK